MKHEEVIRRAEKELAVARKNLAAGIGRPEEENLRLKVEYREAVLDALKGEKDE